LQDGRLTAAVTRTGQMRDDRFRARIDKRQSPAPKIQNRASLSKAGPDARQILQKWPQSLSDSGAKSDKSVSRETIWYDWGRKPYKATYTRRLARRGIAPKTCLFGEGACCSLPNCRRLFIYTYCATHAATLSPIRVTIDLRLIQDYREHRDPKHKVHYTRVVVTSKGSGGDPGWLHARAFSDPMESENVSRSLFYRIFFTRTGVHFA
jgi:hypothetical protein